MGLASLFIAFVCCFFWWEVLHYVWVWSCVFFQGWLLFVCVVRVYTCVCVRERVDSVVVLDGVVTHALGLVVAVELTWGLSGSSSSPPLSPPSLSTHPGPRPDDHV